MRFDTLDEWLAWQETLHPVEMELKLDRVRRVQAALDGISAANGAAPALPFPVLTVAGTNGKGSTVAFAQSLLTAAGVRTGTYTSPHLVRYNERICIDGVSVSDEVILDAFARLDEARGEETLTYFEFGTLAAVEIFRRAEVGAAVLEVGLGGRLDAVNLFDADVAVVTPIDIDHVRWLGSDRESIGREKAGIFRAERPAVIGDPSPPAILEAEACRLGAPCLRLGRDFDAEEEEAQDGQWRWRGPGRSIGALPAPPLAGTFQRANAATALTALDALGLLPPDDELVRQGVAQTRCEGRFQVLPGDVPVVLDIAHNPHAARSLAATLRETKAGVPGREVAVAGMLGDKDAAGVVEALSGVFDEWFVARPAGERGGAAEELAAFVRAREEGAPVTICADVPAAFRRAREQTSPGDRIVVFGSCHTVGEVLAARAA